MSKSPAGKYTACLVATLLPLLGATAHKSAPSARPALGSLVEAVYQDDLETAQRLLRSGADVNAANRYGVAPLSLACANGNLAMVEKLLAAGANANTAQPSGETALMTAARSGNAAVVKTLLAHGANVNARETTRGQSALMWAAAEGHEDVVDVLLRAGADARLRLISGFTPLLFAVREGQSAVVRRLLQAGLDVNEPLQIPVQPGQKPPSTPGGPRVGETPLHIAVGNAHYELAAQLLDAGANPNANGPGYTVLHTITWIRKPGGGDNDPAPRGSGSMSSLELVRKLAAKGADLNARMTRRINVGLTSLNTHGATPFLLAARTGDAQLMRALAALGADPLLPTVDNSTPLIVAAGLGTRSPGEDAGTEAEVVEAVKAALELGNDINAVDNNGETAMHGAAYKNLPAVVLTLAEKGARTDVWFKKDKFGWTPLTIAEGYRFGNYKPSPDTVAAVRRALEIGGLPAKTEDIGVRANRP